MSSFSIALFENLLCSYMATHSSMWEVTRSLAEHAHAVDPAGTSIGGGESGGSSDDSSFKKRIEIPLAVSAKAGTPSCQNEDKCNEKPG